MKKFLGTVLALCLFCSVSAQSVLSGVVISHEAKAPIVAASVSIWKNERLIAETMTDENGQFKFDVSTNGLYKVKAGHISHKKTEQQATINGAVSTIVLELMPATYYLDPLEVRSVRAGDKAPFTKTNLTQEYIKARNFGQDLPFLLDQTPSVVVNSDAGNGVGYTGIRIRGSDASRINVTMNGIPYNDAESQGTFFVDMPDIASSINSIQIQRGVGTSSNGAGAFGATINLSTNEFNEAAYAEINNSYGSFNTWKNTVKAGSGLLNEHFTVDARLSRLSSDGYISRASSDLQSFYLSGAWLNKTSSVRLNIISGKEKTYQAWNGVSESTLQTDRRFNSAGTEKPGVPYDNETDNYVQTHYQLFFNHALSNRLAFNTALFLTTGKGYYEQYKAGEAFTDYGLSEPVINGAALTETDLIRQLWLDNKYFGQILSLQYKTNKDQVTFGGGWSRYNGLHFGEIIWASAGIPNDYRYYDVDAFKTDVNVYAKWQHALSNRLTAFADVQGRSVRHKMDGFRNNPGVTADRTFNFINPKLGLTYTNKGLQSYISYSVGNKEPNRDDFEAGIAQQPTFETLHNIEAGLGKKEARYSYNINLFYMYYRNQLVLTGKINDVGAYTRENIPVSYRAGVELQGTWNLASVVSVDANLAFSKNKIQRFVEFVDDYDTNKQIAINHNDVDISFSPSVVGSATINVNPVKNITISLMNKYVARQYLDNTQDENRSLDPYFLQDARVKIDLPKKVFREWSLVAQVNNIFNKKYEPNGYTFSYVYGGVQSTENYYFPMAGTNALVALNITL